MRRLKHTAVAIAADVKTARQRIVDALFLAMLTIMSIPPLYLAKSALGINLMPGHSPLHDLLYWIVR